MKKYIILSLVFFFSIISLFGQDSLYLYKDNKVILKYAVDNIDSITFIRPKVAEEPLFLSFSFEKANNDFLQEDNTCSINNTQITSQIPLFSRSLVATFMTNGGNSVSIDGVPQVSGQTINDFSNPVVYTVTSSDGKSTDYTVTIDWKTDLPHINIDTKSAVTSKDEYVRAYLSIDGNGFYEDFSDSTRIRGRGNTTWGNPKKPYKLKLDSKEALFGMKKEKDWVLLANYIDPTHMSNLVALRVGQLLGLPFTNHAVPVNVTMNGEYIGIYTFTEQIERKKNRINIDKTEGVLLELDSYFDEMFQFKSPYYQLPVMVKYPDLEDEEVDVQNQLFAKIKSDFSALEQAMTDNDFPNNNYKDLIDVESLVKFMIVFDLTDNRELNHPKSTYMHKDKDGKYVMGPIWDFDWAYGYEGSRKYFSSYTKPLLEKIGSADKGTDFFLRFMQDPEVKKLYKEQWAMFRTQYFPILIKYIEDTSLNITQYQKLDYQKWGKGTSDYPNKIHLFKLWLQKRANYISNKVAHW